MSDDTTPGDETATAADPAERVDAAGSEGLTATLEAPPEAEVDHGVPVTWSRGQKVLHPDREGYHDLVAALHDEGFVVCVDVTAVDFLTHAAPRHLPVSVVPERFEVVVGLLNHAERTRVRIRVQVPESDPVLPTIFDLHPGAEAPEREVFDMFGIAFTDHPDLTRILMPEDWQGHPLRKDYDSGRIPVQFKAATNQR